MEEEKEEYMILNLVISKVSCALGALFKQPKLLPLPQQTHTLAQTHTHTQKSDTNITGFTEHDFTFYQ
jgi:hypothetical protein